MANTNVIDFITLSTPGNATDFGDMGVATRDFNATSNGTNDRGIACGGSATNVIEFITISSTGNASDFGDLVGIAAFTGATSNGIDDRGVISIGER